MLNLIKPGYVLRFGICPSTLTPPIRSNTDTFSSVQWPIGKQNLGNVSVISHPSGALADIASRVATGGRGGFSASRSASYSKVGNFIRKEVTGNTNVAIGAAAGDFVGYTDGQTNFVQSAGMVFSKDFSGCLMVVYTINGIRHVAHAAASSVAGMDCKQNFLTGLQNNGAVLNGWFKPYTNADDLNRKLASYDTVKNFIGNNINNLVTFGAVSAGGQAYSIDAFKPAGVQGNDWVVTSITPKNMSQAWNV